MDYDYSLFKRRFLVQKKPRDDWTRFSSSIRYYADVVNSRSFEFVGFFLSKQFMLVTGRENSSDWFSMSRKTKPRALTKWPNTDFREVASQCGSNYKWKSVNFVSLVLSLILFNETENIFVILYDEFFQNVLQKQLFEILWKTKNLCVAAICYLSIALWLFTSSSGWIDCRISEILNHENIERIDVILHFSHRIQSISNSSRKWLHSISTLTWLFSKFYFVSSRTLSHELGEIK